MHLQTYLGMKEVPISLLVVCCRVTYVCYVTCMDRIFTAIKLIGLNHTLRES